MNLSNILVETGLCQIEPKLQLVKCDDYIVNTKALCHGIAHDTENSLNSLKNDILEKMKSVDLECTEYMKLTKKQEEAFWKALDEFNYEIGELYSVYIDEGSSIIISIGYFIWDISKESFIFNGLRFICYKNKDKKEDTDSDKIDFDYTGHIIVLVSGIAMAIGIIIAAVCSNY